MTRMNMKHVGALTLTLVAISPSAHAYLDPGTGSMLLQLLIAGVLGALFTIKMWWYRVKQSFARLMGKDVEPPPEPAGTDDTVDADGKQRGAE